MHAVSMRQDEVISRAIAQIAQPVTGLCDAGKLIWGMLASGLLFGLTSMIGLDMWLVFNKPRRELQSSARLPSPHLAPDEMSYAAPCSRATLLQTLYARSALLPPCQKYMDCHKWHTVCLLVCAIMMSLLHVMCSAVEHEQASVRLWLLPTKDDCMHACIIE